MLASMLVPIILYVVLIWIVNRYGRPAGEYKRLFSSLVIPLLPLAFSYHIAHSPTQRLIAVPVLLFLVGVTVFNLWLLMQPMIMRM